MKPSLRVSFLRISCLAVPLFASLLQAQTFTWDGGGGDDLFGSGQNWVDDLAPGTGGGVVLRFDGSTRPGPENNYTIGDNFGEWRLASSAGADFAISGNGFGLFSKIENEAGSGRLLTINTAGIYARDNIEINPVGGNIRVGALVTLDDNRTLNVYDGENGNTLTLNGILSNGNGNGGNGALVLNQTATVVLAADGNNYGATTLNAGTTLRVGAGGATGSLGSGDVTNNGSLVFDRSGALTVANGITGSGSVSVQAGTITFNNKKFHTGGTSVANAVLDLTGGGGQDGTLRGTVTVGNGGTLRLSTGDATGWGTGVQRITAITVNEGGTLNVNTASNQTFSNLALTLQGGTISGIAGSNFDFFNGSSSLTTLASATLSTVSMNARLRQATTTFEVANGDAAVDLLWSGQLNQEGAGRNFVKSGDGRMNLTGAATYSGTSTINGGHLLVSSEWRNTSSITVNNGSTLELGATNMFVGGHGTALASTRVITVNASTLLMNGSMDSRIGNITLNNASTWTSNRGLTGWDVLLANTSAGAATVTVSGSGVSTMNGSGGIHLQGIQNFNVANTSGDAEPDLLVSMRLDNPGNTGGAAGGVRKQGEGTMLLNNTGNSFAGDLIVEQGTLRTGTGQGGGTTGHLGAVNGTRTITVNTGATLEFRANNQFGGSGKNAGTIPQIVLDGGTLDSTRFNILGNVTMNAATLRQSTTDTGSYEGYQFLGTITVGGNAASTISSGNGRANHLVNGTTTFDVTDATGDAAADLIVSAPLRNASADYASGAGSLTKTGAGTLLLSGNNTYTGTTTVSAGTLLVTGALGNTAVTVETGAAIGGSGSLGGSLSFSTGSFLDLAMSTISLNASDDILSVAGSITLTDFSFANLLGWDASTAEPGTYTLIQGGSSVVLAGSTPTVSSPFDFGNGKQGYFQQGSLQVVVIPEPSAALLGALGLLALLRRRR
jgi:fibronectin-binding autotransporter adhesin